ncbi:putative late blight resistance protein homolog R1B-13 [Andrographis paniculata]|uniref:putative late blight resistance protein homolog R1B-13 n=1 Tax=Andrographis paniculata TaxID=175694 RepID=UPI0021E8F106|nr:putative late blight resistance protein homolog R1B-13 [Andrographis paniculata]XP_051133080.1 putative late blight resistance protein homolog R1B-13 [Andrographis paniculata]XP_051133081.1 putative late blight resistance protein homolog R1B-13 [Andrographis paniculata]
MAAYAFLAPVDTLLHHLLNSSQVHLLRSDKKLLQFSYNKVVSLQKAVEDFETLDVSENSCKKAKFLDRLIKEAVRRFEDILEPHLSTQYLSQIANSNNPNHPRVFVVDLKEVKEDISSFTRFVMAITMEYVENMKSGEKEMSSSRSKNVGESTIKYSEGAQLDYLQMKSLQNYSVDKVEEVEYEEECWRPTSNYQMVGLVDQFVELKTSLVKGSHEITIISGMAGIGKTTLARQLFNDPLISSHFKYRAFVSIGQKYELKQVVIDILSQMEDHDIEMLQCIKERELLKYWERISKTKRYLLVLDDVWSLHLSSSLKLVQGKGRTLVTSRIESVFAYSNDVQMRFLSEDESWFLLREKVFGKDSLCPSELVEVGKKIAKNCEGLPLAIVAIAKLLRSKGEETLTLEYWNIVSEDDNPLSIGNDDQDPMMNTLYSSYEPLIQSLKAFFLYMGVFPRRFEMVASKLFKLWLGEGFIKTRMVDEGDWEEICMMYLNELRISNVVLIIEVSLEGKIKTCKLHSVFWHLCVGEARKEDFFRIVRGYSSDLFAEWIKGQRRLCVQNNTLFGIKDSYNLISSVSSARSLLCTGVHHNYPVRMCFEMMLLRVLDALTIRFYVFPYDVVKLMLLRYLAFTYTGLLHSSISQLWNLRFLIIRRHLCIISPKAPLLLPVEIWQMKELRHLEVTGGVLPEPYAGAILPKLATILDISAQSFRAKVVDAIPNVDKLGIEIDSSADDPFSFFDNISRLENLTSLKCSVINPKPKSQAVAPPAPAGIFPPKLRKLSLSGFGYPWKYMREIGELECLEVLKLKNYAFHGVEWKSNNSEFPNLRFLCLEDLDLVRWRCNRSSFRRVRKLVIRHCYKLQKIPEELGIDPSEMEVMELVEVKPSVVASAKNVILQRKKKNVEGLQLYVDCEWEDELPRQP